MIVYHWTSFENAKEILKTGLKKYSFVCKDKDDWQGEICLEIDLPYNIDWETREECASWQAIVKEKINKKRISVVINYRDYMKLCGEV